MDTYAIPREWMNEGWYKNHIDSQLSDLNEANFSNKDELKTQVTANKVFIYMRDAGTAWDDWSYSHDPKRIFSELKLLGLDHLFGQHSVKREFLAGLICDESIALAMVEEKSGSDGDSQLTEC